MPGLRLALPWSRRRPEPPSPEVGPPRPPAPPPIGPPFPRPVVALRHEWLDVTVARATLLGPLPVGRARVVAHAWPRGEERPLDAVARAFTDAEGAVSFHLPVGRYALTATLAGESRTVAVTLERAGRATILLEEAPRVRTHTVHVEVVDEGGRPVAAADVEAVPLPGGAQAFRARTDARGLAPLALPPGAYDVHAGGRALRAQVTQDARLRVVREGSVPDEDEAWLRGPAD